MATAVLESPAGWQEGLQKKHSFEATCQALVKAPGALAGPEGRALTLRARTLLRSRFTGRPFWVAGRQLFRAAAAQAGADAAYRQQLEAYIAECDEFLGDAAGTSAAQPDSSNGEQAGGQQGGIAALLAGLHAPPSRGAFLFEGQLSGAEQQEAARQPQDRLLELLAGRAVAAQAPGTAGQAEGQAGRGAGAEEQRDGQEQPAAEQQLTPEAIEALERELDAIAVRVMEETGQEVPRGAPPASKRVVASLPKEQLTAERLQQLGGADTRCPVCMDEFGVGDEVQALPCRHVFHPPCLAPWLQDNNSCPTCRHELPTDDQRYERRKEREKVEEEERRGAANALSHNEFLYI